MAMSSSTFNFRKLPWACIAAILVILALNTALTTSLKLQRFLFIFSEPSKSDPYRLYYLLNEAQNHNGKKIFLMGTSQSREGFDVRRLNQEFSDYDITVFNFGGAAYSAIDFYMQIQEILNADPNLIVYMPYAGNFYLDYDFKRLKYNFHPQVVPLFTQQVGQDVLYRYKRFFLDAFLADLFPLYKYRVEFQPILFNFVKHLLSNIGDHPKVKYFNYTEDFSESYFVGEIERYEGRKFYFSSFTPAEKAALEKAVEHVKQSGTKFLIIDGPVNPKIEAVYESGVQQAYTQFIKAFAAQHGVPLIELSDQPAFDENDFIDFTHLNAGGRHKMTSFISDYLKKNYQTLFQKGLR